MVRRSAETTPARGQIFKQNSMKIQGIGKAFRPVGAQTESIDPRNEDDRH
jgi:hypothetical protein